MKKRILSILTVFALIFSAIPFAYAADTAEVYQDNVSIQVNDEGNSSSELNEPAISATDTIAMNKDSATIQIGDTLQLSVNVNGTNMNADAWGSSDTSIASVDSNGVVTALTAGSVIITAMKNGITSECLLSVVKRTSSGNERYNVLILDASGSMRGSPLDKEKSAAKRFCQTILNSEGDNYLAVISLKAQSEIVTGFTNKYNTLESAIDSITAKGNTNMNDAFKLADKLMSSVSDGSSVMKNIVLCSDGLPQTGASAAEGRYNSDTHIFYKYSNVAYNTGTELKSKGYFIYALGFFYNSSGTKLSSGKLLMKDLASKDKYYIINEIEDIDTVFDDIAQVITDYSISQTSVSVSAGTTYRLNMLYKGVVTQANSWSSDNPSVASVDSNGLVTCISKGTAHITAVIDGKEYTCTVNVTEKKISVTLNSKNITLWKGQTKNLSAIVKNSDNDIIWTSDNPNVASVSDNGVVTAVGIGSANIYASVDGVSAKCVVQVKSPTISLNKNSVTIRAGKTYTINASVSGPSKNVTWKTSDKSIATVSSKGVVTGKLEGKCTITATANGVTAKCTVNVTIKHPKYSAYFLMPLCKSNYGSERVNEYGVRLSVNKGATISKCAVYISQSGSTVKRTIACKGRNIKQAYYVPYLSRNGKIKYDGKKNKNINTFVLNKNSDNIWSVYGRYYMVTANLKDANGKDLVVQKTGVSGENTKIFYDYNEMIKWLKN